MPPWVTHLEVKPVHVHEMLDLRSNKLKASQRPLCPVTTDTTLISQLE